jgi:16S rRNA (guanine966-N2)-methyltransferase
VTRIIAGSAGGRHLQVPARGTRPTSDRVREAIFSSIGSWLAAGGRDWSGICALDLYAGTGALGLEAASRGARMTVLVERHPQAVAVIRRNARACGLTSATVLAADATELAEGSCPYPAFELCLVDPPYGVSGSVVADLLTMLGAGGWLAPEALLVVERSAVDPSPLPDGWPVRAQRRYGDTAVWYGHYR